jgi:flagellar assembly factor FliW
MFKGLFENYTNMMLEYNIKLIEEKVDEISISQEDDKNFFNLLELNKKGMNSDIFNILYTSVMSAKGQKKFAPYIVDI